MPKITDLPHISVNGSNLFINENSEDTGYSTISELAQNIAGGKMDTVSSPTSGDILTVDSNGQAVDSGTAVSEMVKSVNDITPDQDGNVDIVALPEGGTQGQALIKQSSQDGDADWETLPQILSGTTIPSSSLGNDGDIYIMYKE